MLSLLVCLALAGADVEPRAFALETRLSVWDVAAEDINGDGKADLAALCCDTSAHPLKKHVAVFLADPSGGYKTAPSFTLDVDARTGPFFWAETDGQAPRELVATHAGGATVYAYENGALKKRSVSEFPSLLPGGLREPRFLNKSARDLTGDGKEEWLIPGAAGYQVRTAEETLSTIPCDMFSEIRNTGSLQIVHRLPSCHVFDQSGTEQKGVAFLSDEFADFAFGDQWAEHKRFPIPLKLEDNWEASTRMDDINGDGQPDLVVTQTQGTVKLKVLTQVYIATGPQTYPKEPTAAFEAVGTITSPLLMDINGDEKLDVVFIKVPFGVKAFVNYFLRGKLGIQVDVYLYDGAGFPPEPSFHTSVSIDAPDGRQRAAYTMGDYNGDGRADVAFGSGADKLIILTGSDKDFVSQKPWMTFELPTFGTARTHDLNGNPAKDIVMFHPNGDHDKRIDVLVF